MAGRTDGEVMVVSFRDAGPPSVLTSSASMGKHLLPVGQVSPESEVHSSFSYFLRLSELYVLAIVVLGFVADGLVDIGNKGGGECAPFGGVWLNSSFPGKVRWEDHDGGEIPTFYSVSTDGRLTHWKVYQSFLQPFDVIDFCEVSLWPPTHDPTPIRLPEKLGPNREPPPTTGRGAIEGACVGAGVCLYARI